MKPAIVWQLRHQQAFDRAMERQLSRVPNKQEIVERFRQHFVDSVERLASRKPFDPTAEHTVKYKTQRKGYQEAGDPPPPAQPVEEWLEVRYRFVDAGKTAEIVSVISAKFPDI